MLNRREAEPYAMTTVTEPLTAISEKIRNGQLDEARTELLSVDETPDNRADLFFLQGYLKESEFDREGAIVDYESALECTPDHEDAAFRAAWVSDLLGDDDAAVDYYELCVKQIPVRVAALVNLAVIHEERGNFIEAETLLRSVVDKFPTHHRANHLLKSVESSVNMTYDETSQQEREKHDAILDMPISDFELSVRSRNCLRQMNIFTLGDLLRTSESELLSYKNFGETSLSEIKVLLAQQNLRLGQSIQPIDPPTFATDQPVSIDASANTNLPISELELSVRSRKALQRLSAVTMGDLAQHTEDELMAIKNFGQTSLIEIKRQLEKFGLSFRLSTPK